MPSKIKPSYAFHLHSLVLSARSELCRKLLENRTYKNGQFDRSSMRYSYSYDHSQNKHLFELENVNVDVFQELGKNIKHDITKYIYFFS